MPQGQSIVNSLKRSWDNYWNDQIQKAHILEISVKRQELQMPVLHQKSLAYELEKNSWSPTSQRFKIEIWRVLGSMLEESNFDDKRNDEYKEQGVHAAVTDVWYRSRLSTSWSLEIRWKEGQSTENRNAENLRKLWERVRNNALCREKSSSIGRDSTIKPQINKRQKWNQRENKPRRKTGVDSASKIWTN